MFNQMRLATRLEFTAASAAQSPGVGPINAAVSPLSQTTQQNATSSEEPVAGRCRPGGSGREPLRELLSAEVLR